MVISISVDGWDGQIDWSKVKKDPHDVKLAFIRSSGDGFAEDKKFKENFNNAKKQGMEVGVQHDFGMVSSPEEHLQHIFNMLAKVEFNRERDKLVIHATKGFGGEDLEYLNSSRAKALKDLLDKLKSEDYNPIIKTSPGVWDTYYNSVEHDFCNYSLWVFDPSPRETPNMPEDWKGLGKYEYWTYNTRDTIEGISHSVCLNKESCDIKREVGSSLEKSSVSLVQEKVQGSFPS